MSRSEDEFLRSLRATFQVEANEHLQAISDGLLALEKVPDPGRQATLIETIFRAAHSLKGAARAVNLTDVETTCQALEDTFAHWKRQPPDLSASTLDGVHQRLDDIVQLLASPKPLSAALPLARPALLVEPRPAPRPAPPTPSPETARRETSLLTAAASTETVRIAVAKLDDRLVEAEEMLTAKLAANQRVAELATLGAQLEDWQKEWVKLQPAVRNLRYRVERPGEETGRAFGPALMRLTEHFEWTHEYLRAIEQKITLMRRAAEQDRLTVSKLVDDLLDSSKKLLMLPWATIAQLLPKVVRDLCRDQGKEADLILTGEEVVLDKRVLEEMKDPLIHLLRNCVDHGIELPEERRRLGKPARAAITIAVSSANGSKVELRISDDGAGIDIDKVKTSALQHRLISPEEAARLSETEAAFLIFKPEVSTSAIITRLSGRGLGLAIVQEKTEKLGGSVSVESQRHKGTTIRITLPAALATFRGILVEVAQRLFVIPTAQVERVARFKADDVRSVEGREALSLLGRAVALVRLAEVLELTPSHSDRAGSNSTPIVLLGAGDQTVAFAVDGILGEQEVLVKRLTKPLSRVRNIAGATVLATGQIVPILNVSDLLKAARQAGRPSQPAVPERSLSKAAAKAILVVEDSITSRLLLKGILEAAGYRVRTAVDGVEAFASLRAEPFDLVISDVEMPRLNGFDLTARIRADQKLAELPVILITALETLEDRERGIEAGANAYLVKSRFDQSELLEMIAYLA